MLLCCIKDVFNRTNHFTSNSFTTMLIRHHVDVLICLWDNRLVDFVERYVSRISVTKTSLQITSKLRQDVSRDVPIAGWFKTTVDK